MNINLSDEIIQKLEYLSKISNNNIEMILNKFIEEQILNYKNLEILKSDIQSKAEQEIFEGNDLIEKSLLRKEAEFNAIFNSITDALILSDNNRKIVLINPAFTKMFGYVLEEVKGKTSEILYQSRKSYNEQKEKYINGDKKGQHLFEVQYMTKDGKLFFAETLGIPVKDSAEKVIGFLGIHRDISERKKTEMQLKENEKRYRLIFNSSNDALLIHEAPGKGKLPGKIIEVNDIACQRLGYTREELLQMSPIDFDDPETLVSVPSRMEELLREKHAMWEGVHVTKTGEKIPVEINNVIFEFEGKEIICATARDLSERKKAESEQLRLQNLESLGILAGGIAHDFNNILTAIMGQASIAQMRSTNENVNKSISSIIEATRRAVGLTHQLLTFAKGGTPQKTLLSVRKIIDETTRFSLSGSNIIPEFNFKDTVNLEADPSQLSQVIQNIVINAKQAMPNGGKILISTEDFVDYNGKHSVKISIKDSGMGISKDNLKKIFDPYYTTKRSGTGLGLSVCHSIIKRHGGEIHVNSQLGIGTTFEIVLPASENIIIKQDTTPNMTTKTVNVLIMDDENSIREILREILEALGHKVTTAKEGNEAVKIYDDAFKMKKSFDVVFLDLTIRGGLGGKETLKKIREINPRAKVIVSSGYADTSISNYKIDGFDAKLNKPYTINEVNEIIYKIINE